MAATAARREFFHRGLLQSQETEFRRALTFRFAYQQSGIRHTTMSETEEYEQFAFTGEGLFAYDIMNGPLGRGPIGRTPHC